MKKFIGLFLFAALFFSLVSCGKTYIVSFDTNGGNEITAVETEDGKITAPTDPTKEGFTFAGWYLDSELKNKFDFNTEIEADTTLYASWTALTTYTVKFNTNGAQPIADITTDYTGKITAPKNPVKDYYEFAGWYDNEALTGEAVKLADKVFTADTALYAKWNIIEVMDYATFMEAETGDLVAIEGYIAAKQSWWANKATMYLVGDTDGEGYFIYEMAMTEDVYNNVYKIGTKVRIYGAKANYAGEHEISGEYINYDLSGVIEGEMPEANPIDLTYSVDDEVLIDYQNAKFTATLKVKEYTTTDQNATVATNGAYGYKGDEPTDDLYFILEDQAGNVLNCCVEKYLTSTYAAVKGVLMDEDFAVGKVVTVEGYMYWYNGANPHITSITITEQENIMYETFMSTPDGEDVVVEGFLIGKTTYYKGMCSLYLSAACTPNSGGEQEQDYTTGEGYYVYNYECTQEQYNALVVACDFENLVCQTYVKVSGTKASYAGMKEIVDATVEIISVPEGKIMDIITVDFGPYCIMVDEITEGVMSAGFQGNFTVVEYTTTDPNATVAESGAYGYKGDDPTDDLYIILEDSEGNKLNCCIEAHLDYEAYGSGYKNYLYSVVDSLTVGQTISVTGFMYWWNGPNPHIIFISTGA